jgi:ribonuclease HI
VEAVPLVVHRQQGEQTPPSPPLSAPTPSSQRHSQASHPSQPPRQALEVPIDLRPPFLDVDWSAIRLSYAAPPPLVNPPQPQQLQVTVGSDYQAIICPDGSYIGTKSHANYGRAGCGFICHILTSNETWVAAKHLPASLLNNSAPVAEAEATLMALNFILSKGITKALVIHDNNDMHLFICNMSKSKKKCSRYAKLKSQIVALLGRFDTVFGCHVRSHQGKEGLPENEAADRLANLFTNWPQLVELPPTRLLPDANTSSTIFNALNHRFNNRFNPLTAIFDQHSLPLPPLPVLSTTPLCEQCGCPSHTGRECFRNRSRLFMSSFCRIKPTRKTAFHESFSNPGSIEWDEAPPVLSDHVALHFMGSMFSLSLNAETHIEAWNALMALPKHYFYYPPRSKLIKKKPKVHHDSVGPCFDERADLRASELEAKKLHTFANIAHDRKWGRAMNFVHKTDRISPLDSRLADQWDAIHPAAPTPDDELFIPYDPSAFRTFQIDRGELSKKIDSWDITKAAGLSGFPPAFLIYFNNLTAKNEDPQNPCPYFTALLLFIEAIASGKMEHLRETALNYKGSFLNKIPSNAGFKIRNLGMSDTFHRLASYSILSLSIPHAIEAGLLTDFDLGSGKLGGIEKFVKMAQMMARDKNVTILSSDIEKAYNNVLRTDTWAAVQEIGFEPLIQWFIYAYGDSPWVNYTIDYNLPAKGSNLKRVRMPIGFPQGDNLSGFLFSITMRYILKQFFKDVQEQRSPVCFATVLDDTMLAVNTKLVRNVGSLFKSFIDTLKAHNLRINFSKSIVFCSEHSLSLIAQIRRISPSLRLSNDGFDVCKIPIGSKVFIDDYIQSNYIPRIDNAFDCMHLIWNALQYLTNQEQLNTFFIFLRLCFASKFIYWLRNLLPASAQPISDIIDAKIDILASKLYPQLPSTTTIIHPLFKQMQPLSRCIEALPLSMNGAGITRMRDIRLIGHFATCAESFNTVLSCSSALCLSTDAHGDADDIRNQLFPSVNDTITSLLGLCSDKMKATDFIIVPGQEYRGLQKLVSTAYYITSHRKILESLPTEEYQSWFLSRKESFTSLALNSSVRHVTGMRPPKDSIFKIVLAMRTLRPIFHMASCGCGDTVDVCGFHFLKCKMAEPSPFVSIHNRVRDATIQSFQSYVRRNSPSSLRVFSETDKFQACIINRYYDNVQGQENHRADAIVYEDSDPWHPWFIDFVQAQIEDPNPDVMLRHLSRAHGEKINALVRSYINIPRSSIIPFAFSSNGVLHPAALAFVDWFLCKAARTPINEPPSIEKMKVLHAISKAIVDQTATLLTGHFSKFIHCLHNRTFPINAALSSIPAPRRGYVCRSRQVSAGPPSLTVSGGDAGSIPLRASAVHSVALSATVASPTDSASLRRSSRINFGVPRPSSDLCGPTGGLAVGGRGRR